MNKYRYFLNKDKNFFRVNICSPWAIEEVTGDGKWVTSEPSAGFILNLVYNKQIIPIKEETAKSRFPNSFGPYHSHQFFHNAEIKHPNKNLSVSIRIIANVDGKLFVATKSNLMFSSIFDASILNDGKTAQEMADLFNDYYEKLN